MIPLLLMAAGTAMQMMGQYGANIERAIAEKANADYYRQQAEFEQAATVRELRIAKSQYDYRLGSQVSAAARGGADISGSVLNTIANTMAQRAEELIAIKQKGALGLNLANMRKGQSEQTASMLGSAGYNLTQAATTGVSNYTQTLNNSPGKTVDYSSGGGSSSYTMPKSVLTSGE